MEQDRLATLVASSPVNAPIELIRETLPPTLIQVGEAELLVSHDPLSLHYYNNLAHPRRIIVAFGLLVLWYTANFA